MPSFPPQGTVEVADETGTYSVSSATEGNNTVSFNQPYESGVGSAGFDANVSPITGGDVAVKSYTTDADGNIDGMIIHHHNSTTNAETVRWRFIGLPA